MTFDDGYLDHYTNVFPILNKYGIQGSFYMPIKTITEYKVLDVNKIHFILASTTDLQIVIKDIKKMLLKYSNQYHIKTFEFYWDKLAKDSRYDNKTVIFIKRLLQVELEESLRSQIIDELFKKYLKIDEESFSRELYMNIEQIKCMMRHGMHIGNHGFNHYWWNALDDLALKQELEKSTNFLLKIGVDNNMLTACYPYGSYDQKSISLLKKMGYKLALSTDVGIANIEDRCYFKLPRLDTNDLPKNSSAPTNHWFLNA